MIASSCRSNNATRDHIEWRHLRMHRGWWLYWHTRRTLPSATLKMSSRRKEHHLPVKWNDRKKKKTHRKVEVVCQWFSCAVTGLASYHGIPLLPHTASLRKRRLFLRVKARARRLLARRSQGEIMRTRKSFSNPPHVRLALASTRFKMTT